MNKNFKVLYMDDEINDSNQTIVQEACQKLKDEFSLFSFDNLLDTNQFFGSNVVDAVVLDINMKDGEKGPIYQGIRGTDVANSFKRRVNSLPIIIFSAAGNKNDWFKLSQYGIYAYIDKSNSNSLDELVSQLNKLANDKEINQDNRKKHNLLKKICIIEDSKTIDNKYTLCIEDKFQKCRKDKKMTVDIKEWNDINNNFVESEFAMYDALVWLISQDFIFRRKNEKETLNKICNLSPFPNVIIGAFDSDTKGNGNDKMLIDILNKHPFRMVNLNEGSTFASELGAALDSAISWYGKKEIWGCNPEDVDDDYDDDDD